MKTGKPETPSIGMFPMGLLTAIFGCTVISSGLLSGCMSSSSDSNPFEGLSCEAKIDKMSRELAAFQPSESPLAKAAAAKAISSDSTARTPVDSSVKIQLFHGFPPVTGTPATDTTRLGGSVVDSTPVSGNPATGNGFRWIPPVGFSDSGKTVLPNPLPDSAAPVRETTAPQSLPTDITVVQVVTIGKYKAHVRILDYKNRPVREFDQEFGYQGELQNPARAVANGLVSYLVWDNETATGSRAADGVYLWEIRFTFETGQVQSMSAKTGLLGDECKSEP